MNGTSSSAALPEKAPAEEPPVAGVGVRAAQGFAWTIFQTVVGKLVSVGGQICLAYLLAADEFGEVGLVFVLHAFAGLLQQGGARELLLQRSDRMHRWENAAFWMSLALGAGGALLLIAMAPLAERLFAAPRLPLLAGVLAFTHLFAGFGIVSEAKLMANLRFRRLTMISLAQVSLTPVLSVLFAWLGLGSLSLVLPLPIVALMRALLMWQAAPIRPRFALQLHRWRSMGGQSAMLIGYNLLLTVTWQADYVVLGWLYSEEVVGLYFWAFNLSVQTMQLFAANLAAVLLPSLAYLRKEPLRQANAFLDASTVLAMIGMPACLLQAALAPFAVQAIFEPRWHPGIFLIQVLSIAWAFFTVSHITHSMMKAQGRFRELFLFMSACAGLFLLAVGIGAAMRSAAGAAVGVAVYAMVAGPCGLFVAIRPAGFGWRQVLGVLGMPCLGGIVSAMSAFAAASALPENLPLRAWFQLLVGGVVGVGIAILAARYLCRSAWESLLTRLRGMLKRSQPNA